MTPDAGEFMCCFLLHLLPGGFHRIRLYGLLANAAREANLARARQVTLDVSDPRAPMNFAVRNVTADVQPTFVCRHRAGAMLIIEPFVSGQAIRAPPQLTET